MNLKSVHCFSACVIYYMLRAIMESLFSCQRDVITAFNLTKHTVWIIHSLLHCFYSFSLIPAICLGRHNYVISLRLLSFCLSFLPNILIFYFFCCVCSLVISFWGCNSVAHTTPLRECVVFHSGTHDFMPCYCSSGTAIKSCEIKWPLCNVSTEDDQWLVWWVFLCVLTQSKWTA